MVPTQDGALQRSRGTRLFMELVGRSCFVRPPLSFNVGCLYSCRVRCALIHCHRPDLLDYDKLDKVCTLRLLNQRRGRLTTAQSDRHGNTRLAFKIAADHLNIPQLLEVEDLCDSKRPDEKSVMTYIASFFHAFSSMGKPTFHYNIPRLTDIPQTKRRPFPDVLKSSQNSCSQSGSVEMTTSAESDSSSPPSRRYNRSGPARCSQEHTPMPSSSPRISQRTSTRQSGRGSPNGRTLRRCLGMSRRN